MTVPITAAGSNPRGIADGAPVADPIIPPADPAPDVPDDEASPLDRRWTRGATASRANRDLGRVLARLNEAVELAREWLHNHPPGCRCTFCKRPGLRFEARRELEGVVWTGELMAGALDNATWPAPAARPRARKAVES